MSSVAVLAAAAACRHTEAPLVDTPLVDTLRTITIVSGNQQDTFARRPLPAALGVQVYGPPPFYGFGFKVIWDVKSGGGSVSSDSGSEHKSSDTVVTDNLGHASIRWTLGPEIGSQTLSATLGEIGGRSVEFTADARPPPALIYRYDGTSWNAQSSDPFADFNLVSGIWGASPSYVFAYGVRTGGYFTTGICRSAVLRWDGSQWQTSKCFRLGMSVHLLSGNVSGRSASDVVVLESSGTGTRFSPVWRFDGQSWSIAWSRFGSACGDNGVWADPSSPEAFAVGGCGNILRYDGANQIKQSYGTSATLYGVWGVSKSNVFAVGTGGTIVHYDGVAWAAQSSGTTNQLNAVGGTSATDVFAVGDGGTILHYDGTAWTAQTSGTTQSLVALWLNAPNDVFAVGANATILRYDGTSWSPMNSGAALDFQGVWGSGPNNVFVTGRPKGVQYP